MLDIGNGSQTRLSSALNSIARPKMGARATAENNYNMHQLLSRNAEQSYGNVE